jgi:hypothetical protein
MHTTAAFKALTYTAPPHKLQNPFVTKYHYLVQTARQPLCVTAHVVQHCPALAATTSQETPCVRNITYHITETSIKQHNRGRHNEQQYRTTTAVTLGAIAMRAAVQLS